MVRGRVPGGDPDVEKTVPRWSVEGMSLAKPQSPPWRLYGLIRMDKDSDFGRVSGGGDAS